MSAGTHADQHGSERRGARCQAAAGHGSHRLPDQALTVGAALACQHLDRVCRDGKHHLAGHSVHNPHDRAERLVAGDQHGDRLGHRRDVELPRHPDQVHQRERVAQPQLFEVPDAFLLPGQRGIVARA